MQRLLLCERTDRIAVLIYKTSRLSRGIRRKRERMADVLLHPPLLKIPARALALYR